MHLKKCWRSYNEGAAVRVFFSVMNKELKDIFLTPMIYVLAAIFSLIMGWLFYSLVMNSQSMTELTMTNSVLRPVVGNINILMMLFIPLLTMRCFSIEFKNKTIDLYIMNNTSWTTVYFAKLLAIFISTLFLILPTLIFPVVLTLSGYSDWGVVLVSYLGVILSQLLYISISLFASALTTNVIVAAVISFSILFGVAMLAFSASVSGNYIVGQMVSYLSFIYHYNGFSMGMVRSYDLLYYFSGILIFYYMTVRALDARKW